MGNNQHAAAVALQKAFQPLNHADIQMVGRLVQKEKIRLPEQGLGQADTGFLTAGKQSHLLLHVLLGKSQPEGSTADAALKVIATGMLEPLHQPAIGRQLFLAVVMPDFCLHGFLGSSQRHHICKGTFQLLIQSCLASHLRLLLHIADGISWVNRDNPLVILNLFQQALHQGGLAGTIGSHEAHSFPALYLKTHIIKKLIYTKGLAQTANLYATQI